MIEVHFRNMDTSETLRTYLKDQLREIVFSHPRPALLHTRCTIEVHKTPFQSGRDHFTVKIVSGPNMVHPIVVEKSAVNIQDAVKAALNCFNEVIENEAERHRKIERKQERAVGMDVRSSQS